MGADLDCCGGRAPCTRTFGSRVPKLNSPKKVLSLFLERSELYSPRGTRKRSELSCATSGTPTVLAFEGLARVPIHKASKIEEHGSGKYIGTQVSHSESILSSVAIFRDILNQICAIDIGFHKTPPPFKPQCSPMPGWWAEAQRFARFQAQSKRAPFSRFDVSRWTFSQ